MNYLTEQEINKESQRGKKNQENEVSQRPRKENVSRE